jgi:hypothetical protein
MAHESGGWMALRGLWSRLLQCQPGYTIYFDTRSMGWRIQFANGETADGSCIADSVFAPYRDLRVVSRDHHDHERPLAD